MKPRAEGSFSNTMNVMLRSPVTSHDHVPWTNPGAFLTVGNIFSRRSCS
jgi:hypothetical protein